MLNQGDWQKYSLYGLTLSSDFPFTSRLEPAQSNPDLKFNCQFEPPIHVNLSAITPVYTSRVSIQTGYPFIAVYSVDEVDVLCCEGLLDFYIWPDRIVCHQREPDNTHLVEHRFLGVVMAYWLEQSGIPTFHASATIINSGAIGFLASSYTGKTSLTATFVNAGYPLLVDDVLAVREDGDLYWGQPGYPLMRMWPEQAETYVGNYKALPTVHPQSLKVQVPIGPDGFGSFKNQPYPLQALFLLERIDGNAAININLLSPSHTMFKLLRYAFFPEVLHELPNMTTRLELIGRLVQQVPVYNLSYPAGLKHLPKVCSAILEWLEDVASLKSNRIDKSA